MRTNKPRILILEDSKNLSELIKTLLETHGFKVKKIYTSSALRQNVYKFSPDAVLMDLFLHGEESVSVAQKFKNNEDFTKVPLIMMSAHPEGAIKSQQVGADAFIEKPFDIQYLISVLNNLIK